MKKKVITFGELMMRLSTVSFARFTQASQFNVLYAGSEANVAASLACFGIPAEHVTRFPDNDLGRTATQSLRKYGVNTEHILYGGKRMGTYFLENGATHRSSRIIYDRFDSAFAEIQPGMVDWDEIMKDASWFHWTGITPAISQGAAEVCYEALESARKHNVTVSGDINYRRNLWQYGKSPADVMPPFIELTDIIVGGVGDMENCVGISGTSFEAACEAFVKYCPTIKKIATTVRDSISSSHNRIQGMLWNGSELLHSRAYDLSHIVDRVGAGDAFMAGLIYAFLNEKSDQQAIGFAVAASALKHTIEGDVNLSTAEEVERLVVGENVGVLLR